MIAPPDNYGFKKAGAMITISLPKIENAGKRLRRNSDKSISR